MGIQVALVVSSLALCSLLLQLLLFNNLYLFVRALYFNQHYLPTMSSILRVAVILLGALQSVTAAPVELQSRGTFIHSSLSSHQHIHTDIRPQQSPPISSPVSSSSPNTRPPPTAPQTTTRPTQNSRARRATARSSKPRRPRPSRNSKTASRRTSRASSPRIRPTNLSCCRSAGAAAYATGSPTSSSP
jgi:hypothetical protein